MYVRNHMIKASMLTVVTPEDSLRNALEKINSGDFLSIPVVKDGQIYGILMKEAIYREYFQKDYQNKDEFLDNNNVDSVCNKDFETIKSYERIDQASHLLNSARTPFLAAVDRDGNFEGILTHSSIFNAFSDVFGLDSGERIVVHMFDIPGQLARLTDLLRKEKINIINLTQLDAKVMGIVRVILRLDVENPDDIMEKIQQAGFKIGEFGN